MPEIKKIIETNKTQTVSLTSKPEIYLIYLTTWVDSNGLHFRKDIYERDDKLFDALNEKPVYDVN